MTDYGKLMVQQLQDGKAQTLQPDSKRQFFYLQHSDNYIDIQVRFKDSDKYAIVVDYISLKSSQPILAVEVINQRLEAQSDAIQKNITFLLEAFKLIELDRQNKRAQLRSYPPQTAENSKYYYEVVLDEGVKAHFQRYTFSREGKRYEKITSQLTLEVFERLVNEMVAAL